MDKIIKSVDLSNIKITKNRICWKDSIGSIIPFIYDDISGEILICDYNKNKVLLEYNGYQKWIFTGHLKDAKIGELIGKNTVRFKYEIGQRIVSDCIDITITNRKYEKRVHGKSIINEKLYQYKCNICGFNCGNHYKKGVFYDEFWIIEPDLLNGHGCSCCCATPQVVVQGINDIPTTDPYMIDYFQGGHEEAKRYMKSGSTYIYPKCPHCGKIRNKKMKLNTINCYGSIGCDCGDGISYPEKYFSKLLDLLNVKYIRELTKKDFSWCDKYRYDFYLIDYNIIIETHGMQHYKKRDFGRSFESEKKNDKTKHDIAIKNGISDYIVIDCRYSNSEWISESIKKSKLASLFNLKNEYYATCAEYAQKNNLCKEVCLYYESHKNDSDITMIDIASHFKISDVTLYSYLRDGNIIGWCHRDKNIKNKQNKISENQYADSLLLCSNE